MRVGDAPSGSRVNSTAPNARVTLNRSRDVTMLTWRGPALMLFARAFFAVVAQALVAIVFALKASPTPWRDAAAWLPVYGTLIDAGCLALLWRLTRREGLGLLDLVGFEANVAFAIPRALSTAMSSLARVGTS